MKIEITAQTETVINRLMATGRYASPAEALDAALDERIDPHTGLSIGQLRCELRKGLDDAEAGRVVPAEEAWQRIIMRLERTQD